MCLTNVKLIILCLCVYKVRGNILVHINTKLESSHLIAEIFDGIFHRCADYCVYKTDCLSVSFNSDLKRCDLFRMNSASVIADDKIGESNTILLDIDNWPKSRTGACWNKPCQESSTCVPAGDSYRCIEGTPNVWSYIQERSIYFVPQQSDNFINAKKFCSAHEAHLVNIGSEEENNIILTIVDSVPVNPRSKTFWTALKYKDQKWIWDDTKSDPSFLDWGRLQPDNPLTQGCVVVAKIGSAYHWHDHYCTRKFHFICESP